MKQDFTPRLEKRRSWEGEALASPGALPGGAGAPPSQEMFFCAENAVWKKRVEHSLGCLEKCRRFWKNCERFKLAFIRLLLNEQALSVSEKRC
jgi:hypothetical protein